MRLLDRLVILGLALAGAACAPAGPETAPDPAPVVAAERAFAADAARIGWVEAFETHASAEALLLAAGPVNAHAQLAAIDPNVRGETSLAWAPEFAGVSHGGDFGFTTGPFNGDGTAFGQYFTVWRLEPDGRWKWIYDGGVNWLTPTEVRSEAAVAALIVGVANGASAENAYADVLAAEEALGAAAAQNAGAAYRERFAADGRMNREHQSTAVGAEAAAALAGAGAVRFSPPEVIETAPAGDMAFTLGQARWDEGGAGYYGRIWVMRNGAWRIGYDQIAPHQLADLDEPPEEPPEP